MPNPKKPKPSIVTGTGIRHRQPTNNNTTLLESASNRLPNDGTTMSDPEINTADNDSHRSRVFLSDLSSITREPAMNSAMLDDEAFARQLQEEEDRMFFTGMVPEPPASIRPSHEESPFGERNSRFFFQELLRALQGDVDEDDDDANIPTSLSHPVPLSSSSPETSPAPEEELTLGATASVIQGARSITPSADSNSTSDRMSRIPRYRALHRLQLDRTPIPTDNRTSPTTDDSEDRVVRLLGERRNLRSAQRRTGAPPVNDVTDSDVTDTAESEGAASRPLFESRNREGSTSSDTEFPLMLSSLINLEWSVSRDDDEMMSIPSPSFPEALNRPVLLLRLLMQYVGDEVALSRAIDQNDYDALWELAEQLGEVKQRGITEEEIGKIPARSVTPTLLADADSTECRICLMEYEAGNYVRPLPCDHMFHVECIDVWLKRNATCPICRMDIKAAEG